MPTDDPRVIIIDDDLDTRETIACVLQSMGMENFMAVNTGQKGLDAILAEKFDLIICDWVMPVMTGFDLLKDLQSRRNTRKIPFIMVTAEATPKDLKKAIRAGATDYVLKPFDLGLLQDRIQKALS